MRKVLLAGVALLALAGPAGAAGVNTNGLPQLSPGGAYNNLTGQELLPADTGLANGQVPQSVAPNAAQLSMMLAGASAASATSGAATLNTACGIITSESLTTAAAATYTLTVTDSYVAAASVVWAQAHLKSSTTGGPLAVTSVTPAAGSVVIVVTNLGSAALNGTIVVPFVTKGC